MERQPTENLADIVRKDPKRAKRIIRNRSSAMRAKLRRKMYVRALEINLKKLHLEAAALSGRIDLWQIDSLHVAEDNMRLEECLDNLKAKVQLEDSSIEKLKKEIEDLKKLVGKKKTEKKEE